MEDALQAISNNQSSNILEHLGVIEAAAQASDTRISLVHAGAVAILLARLKLSLEEDEQRKEEICPVLGALLLVCQDQQAKMQAVQEGVVSHLLVCLEPATKESSEETSTTRLAALKYLINLTQGDTKEHIYVRDTIPTFVEIMQRGEVSGGGTRSKEVNEEIQYAAIGLTNLANGSDELKEELVRCGVGRAVGQLVKIAQKRVALEAEGSHALKLAQAELVQGLRLLLPLSYGSAKQQVITRDSVAAVVAAVRGDKSEHAQCGKLGLRVLLNATLGDGKDVLLGCGAVALLSEKAKEGSDESRLTCIKALYGISKCESLTNDEAREGGIINATESVLKARPLLGAEILLHAVRCIVNLSGNAALRPFMSSVCGALSGVLKELGSDAQREIKIKAAQFVVNVSKDSGGVAAAEVCECGLHEEVAKLAQEDGGETQLLALRALLNLSRAGVDVKGRLLGRGIIGCLNSAVRVESGEAQLSAIKAFSHLAKWTGAHEKLLQQGVVTPLIESAEVCAGQNKLYCLQAIRNFTAGRPATRTFLLKCDVLALLCRCGAVEDEDHEACLAFAVESLRNLAKDSTAASEMIRAGVLALANKCLQQEQYPVEVKRNALCLLQRISTASRVQQPMISAGVLQSLIPFISTARGAGSGGKEEKTGKSASHDDETCSLLAALASAPLLPLDKRSGSSSTDSLATAEMLPQVYKSVCSALQLSLDGAGGEHVSFQLYELLLAMRHLCLHKVHRRALRVAGCVVPLGRVVKDRSDDAGLMALAAQTLLDTCGPPGDAKADQEAHIKLCEILGADYYGHLTLAARKLRPQSPDEIDMLLVM